MKELKQNRKLSEQGYAVVRDYYGILGKKGAIVPEHRLIASIMLGRQLESDEIVHHIDLNPSNNSPDNFAIVNSAEHGKIHSNGNNVRRKKASKQISFSGRTPYVKMKCPWCGRIFYKKRSQSVLAHDNTLHVNCCSNTCFSKLNNAVEEESLSDFAKRIRDNVICEFSSNAKFMNRFVNGRCPSYWFIDDNGVFHGDD